MGKPKEEKSWTDRPISGPIPASVPACMDTLLALVGDAERGSDPRVVVGRMLDVLLQLGPEGAAAGVCLELAGGVECIRRASVEILAPPVLPPSDGRLFPELACERSVSLSGPVVGTLHYAASAFVDDVSVELILHQLSYVVSLLWRALDAEAELAASRQDIGHLHKLALLGQSAASIVHELNNPLTAIIAYTEFLQRRVVARNAQGSDVDRLRLISEAALRMQQFCRELIDYSRPAGVIQGPTHLHEIIDRSLGYCMHALREADITVERVYRDVPMIAGVDSQLIQVFVNVITNAWHAMEGPGGSLRITTRHEGDCVVAEVADSGHGIAADVLPRIFDAYFSTKPRGKGAGLGLSIVRQIVADHGGAIRVERREGGGTVFYVELPVAMGS